MLQIGENVVKYIDRTAAKYLEKIQQHRQITTENVGEMWSIFREISVSENVVKYIDRTADKYLEENLAKMSEKMW